MNNTDKNFYDDLQLFYQATRIPVCVFSNTPVELYHFPLFDSLNCPTNTLIKSRELLNRSGNAYFPLIVVSHSCFMAMLRIDEDTNIILGPLSSTPLTYKDFYNDNQHVSEYSDLLNLYRVIQHAPRMSLSQFAASLSLFIKLTQQRELSHHDILKNQLVVHKKNLNTPTEYGSNESRKFVSFSEAITFQKQIIFYLRQGNVSEIEKKFNDTNFFTNLTLTPSSVEELYKIFFIFATICYIASLEEGTDIITAYSIFDSYLNKIPSLKTPYDLANLCFELSLEYCNQIVSLRQNHSDSPVVSQCLNYIKKNLYSKITLDDLADYCNLSRRTITRHFAEYHHTTIKDCIMHYKLKEAVFLLTHSEYSLAEISNQLAFSSQSHFIVAFKNVYHYTPQQFRNKFKKTT